ncbi:hypothetical protein DEM26_18210 [Thioclava sp. NG1]|uniref:peptidoglycan-binding domain-containing protein n=1 Tax=Thioclava sp. NG1 TaxID=2182426 RepID=UPI000D60D06C|nr:peptidoglycan-binding domain-containing protein [Thioclava sp. NG1]PWE48482.1 hypothetical protein DEM26_18210 [Thioclava sp. NG1]
MKFITALATAILFASPALAIERVQLFMFQDALSEIGLYKGDPDGLNGPGTRKAVLDFSSQYGGPKSVDGAFNFALQLSARSRTPIEDPELLKDVKAEVSKELKDPDSAKFRNIFSVKSGEETIICGEVNARNSYGGYAGYSYFYGMSSGVLGYLQIALDDAGKAELARMKCSLAIPKR